MSRNIKLLATHGISMRQFMELQAVFAIVILCGEVPATEGFLLYHLMMGSRSA